LQGQRVVADDLLLDVQDGDVTRDDQLTSGDGPQKRRLAETVAADEAVASPVGQGQVSPRYQNLCRLINRSFTPHVFYSTKFLLNKPFTSKEYFTPKVFPASLLLYKSFPSLFFIFVF